MQVKNRRRFTSVKLKENSDFLQQETTSYWRKLGGQHLTQIRTSGGQKVFLRGKEGEGGSKAGLSLAHMAAFCVVPALGFSRCEQGWVGHGLPVQRVTCSTYKTASDDTMGSMAHWCHPSCFTAWLQGCCVLLNAHFPCKAFYQNQKLPEGRKALFFLVKKKKKKDLGMQHLTDSFTKIQWKTASLAKSLPPEVKSNWKLFYGEQRSPHLSLTTALIYDQTAP